MSQNLGILGGTFNPIHSGHLAAAEEVRVRLKLDRVLFIPSALPPHKQEDDVPSAVQRMEMVRLATADNPFFEPSDIEIKRGGRSYTIDTIVTLLQMYPECNLYFITGLDSFLDIRTWNHWERLLTLCRFVVLSRPGYRFIDLIKMDFMKHAQKELIGLDNGDLKRTVVQNDAITIYLEMITLSDISSTDIRKKVKAGERIKYLLPELVEIYIMKNRLYA